VGNLPLVEWDQGVYLFGVPSCLLAHGSWPIGSNMFKKLTSWALIPYTGLANQIEGFENGYKPVWK